jgi:hypothetical protein
MEVIRLITDSWALLEVHLPAPSSKTLARTIIRRRKRKRSTNSNNSNTELLPVSTVGPEEEIVAPAPAPALLTTARDAIRE